MKYEHAITRARERYAISLTPADLDRMRFAIASNRPEALKLWETPDHATAYAIRYSPSDANKRWIVTLWRGGYPVTVLPREQSPKSAYRSRSGGNRGHQSRNPADLDPLWA